MNKEKAYKLMLFQFHANLLSSDPFLPKILLVATNSVKEQIKTLRVLIINVDYLE